jgi:UDP-N-acetylglucosamine diphosphorylase / glucose-1-phosphate thymidylyltransferase / UDP-N-acetylgalactosamine diphosphorylase / glucosamine-1-phosphate N-acetyltransferase / galactosamine-1-phosphate N-acetyltransferase
LRPGSITVSSYVADFTGPSWLLWAILEPWQITAQSENIVRGAILKGPLILGPRYFVASGAYLRGGNWVDQDCIFGPGAELKSSFMFGGSKLAHFNFVGDSILGTNVNLEAGSVICNYRNERPHKEILVRNGGTLQRTGCEKFGALVGDGSRIGANAVLAPGALLPKASIVRRTELCDQERQ